MTRDRDLDALAEAIAEAQADRSSSWLARLGQRLARWLGRMVRRFVVKAAWPAVAAAAIGAVLVLAHVDLGSLLMPMVWAGPFIAVAVVSFVAYAWRQNSTTPVYGTGQVGQAEPGQVADEVGQASQPAPVGQPVEVGQVAKPAPPTTVTVTVLPTPVAALPQAPTQPDQGGNVYPLPAATPEEEIA